MPHSVVAYRHKANRQAKTERNKAEGENMIYYILTIGLFDKDDMAQHFTTAEALELIQNALISRFGLYAATLSMCYGVYRMASGEVVREPSIRIEIATSDDIMGTIKAAVAYLKYALNQESIMVETRRADISFL